MSPSSRSTAPALAVVLFLVAVAPLGADAQVICICPPVQNSSVEFVLVGGSVGEWPSDVPAYRAIIRDINNTPVVGAAVTLDFSATSIRLYRTQTAGVTVDCSARTLTKLTNAQGLAEFRPRLGGAENMNLLAVRVGQDLLATIKARSTDIDALDATTGLEDFSYFALAFSLQQPSPEVNFDRSQSDVPMLADYAIFAADFKLATVGSYCP